MNIRELRDDTGGSSLVELTLTLPLFLALIFGIVQVGLLGWTWAGLQHGVEMAARCASASDYAIKVGLNPATTPTNCYNTNGSATANAAAVKAYAAANSLGLNPPASAFSVSANPASCPGGNLVSATNYSFNFMQYYPLPNLLNAQSCYPN
jgi:Flp pilus assembly protein TadG